MLNDKAFLLFWAAVVLALCSGRAAAQPDPDEPYGKVVKEIRLPELKWTKEHVILRELVSKVGEVYTRDNAALDLETLDRLDLFVSFDIKVIPSGNQVILELECEEEHPRVIFPAITSTDENGLSVGAGFRTINLAGLGITTGANARFERPVQAGQLHRRVRSRPASAHVGRRRHPSRLRLGAIWSQSFCWFRRLRKGRYAAGAGSLKEH